MPQTMVSFSICFFPETDGGIISGPENYIFKVYLTIHIVLLYHMIKYYVKQIFNMILNIII